MSQQEELDSVKSLKNKLYHANENRKKDLGVCKNQLAESLKTNEQLTAKIEKLENEMLDLTARLAQEEARNKQLSTEVDRLAEVGEKCKSQVVAFVQGCDFRSKVS